MSSPPISGKLDGEPMTIRRVFISSWINSCSNQLGHGESRIDKEAGSHRPTKKSNGEVVKEIFVACTVAYAPKPRFRSRLIYVMTSPRERSLGKTVQIYIYIYIYIVSHCQNSSAYRWAAMWVNLISFAADGCLIRTGPWTVRDARRGIWWAGN